MQISIQKTTTLFIVLALSAAFFLTAVSMVKAEEVKPPLRATIKANVENRIEQNKEVRNTLLEKKQEIKREIKDVRMEKREDIKELRADARAELKLLKASSTDMFKKSKDIRQEIRQKMEAKQYEIRKGALVKELNISLTNLATISTRIEAHITKVEGQGRAVGEARTLLAAANDKLTAAKSAVAAFEASTNVTASTTAEVDLAKPRVAGDAAIKAVKEARDAFQKVVVAIAKAQGANANATTTNSTEN